MNSTRHITVFSSYCWLYMSKWLKIESYRSIQSEHNRLNLKIMLVRSIYDIMMVRKMQLTRWNYHAQNSIPGFGLRALRDNWHFRLLASINILPIGPLGGLVNLPSRTATLIRFSNVGIQLPNNKSLLLVLNLACCTCLSILLISFRRSSSLELFNQMRKEIYSCT